VWDGGRGGGAGAAHGKNAWVREKAEKHKRDVLSNPRTDVLLFVEKGDRKRVVSPKKGISFCVRGKRELGLLIRTPTKNAET